MAGPVATITLKENSGKSSGTVNDVFTFVAQAFDGNGAGIAGIGLQLWYTINGGAFQPYQIRTTGAFGIATWDNVPFDVIGSFVMRVNTSGIDANAPPVSNGVDISISGGNTTATITLTPTEVNHGDPVVMDGSGFVASESVRFVCEEGTFSFQVLADAQGHIHMDQFGYYLWPDNVQLHITAIGLTSSRAAQATLLVHSTTGGGGGGGGGGGATLQLNPTHGPPGTNVHLIGSGFLPSVAADVTWQGLGATDSFFVDAGGAFDRIEVIASTTTAGQYLVTVKQTPTTGSPVSASAMFVVDPGTGGGSASISANPSTVTDNQPFTLSGDGFVANEGVTITLDDSIAVGQINCDAQGAFSLQLHLSVNVNGGGAHIYRATGLQSGRSATTTVTLQTSGPPPPPPGTGATIQITPPIIAYAGRPCLHVLTVTVAGGQKLATGQIARWTLSKQAIGGAIYVQVSTVDLKPDVFDASGISTVHFDIPQDFNGPANVDGTGKITVEVLDMASLTQVSLGKQEITFPVKAVPATLKITNLTYDPKQIPGKTGDTINVVVSVAAADGGAGVNAIVTVLEEVNSAWQPVPGAEAISPDPISGTNGMDAHITVTLAADLPQHTTKKYMATVAEYDTQSKSVIKTTDDSRAFSEQIGPVTITQQIKALLPWLVLGVGGATGTYIVYKVATRNSGGGGSTKDLESLARVKAYENLSKN